MYDILFKNGTILSEDGPIPHGYLLVRGENIAAVGAGEPHGAEAVQEVDLAGAYLSPGFIDAHTHGAGGCDFMDGTVEAIVTASRMHLRHGTTSVCPTTLCCPDEELYAFFDHYVQARAVRENMPRLIGIHMEGPYFSPAQAGAQPPAYMKTPYPDHFVRTLERSGGNIVRWSCAPEVPGVLELGDELVKNGILPSIAHTDADAELVGEAMAHGFSLLTHFYSGMSQLKRVNGHRVLGAIEAGYLYDGLNVELIADGIHLPPLLLKLILKCKPHDKISLVTDSMRAAGMPEGPSVLGGLQGGYDVIVEDGVAKTIDRQSFAGSVATADRMIRVMTMQAGLPLHEAVAMMSRNPARLLGIDALTGSIKPAKKADLLVFGEEIDIRRIYVGGVEVELGKESFL